MLKLALKSGDEQMARYLLERDAWLANEPFGRPLTNRPIHIACEYGHLGVVKVLVEDY